VDLPLAPSYAVLCLVQGLLVLAPWKPYTLTRSRAVGLLIPVLATAAGVGIVRGFADGADALTTLATVATPALAAIAGWARRWPLPWVPLVVTPALYLIAWQYPDTLGGDAAGLALIGAACLTLAALIAALTPPWALAVGLVVVVAVDVIFVWGINQVEPATIAVHQAVPPSASVIPGEPPKPLPALQDGTFGSALMGWLDFLAPALLGTLFVGRVRVQVAVATTLAALAWGLLLLVTDPVAATVPVLVGLAVGGRALRADTGLVRRDATRYAPVGLPPAGPP
jgi:hypothetical protein